MRYNYTSLVKGASLSIIVLSVYTALSISRLPPSPTILFSSILLVIGYISLSFNIIWVMGIEWRHLIVFTALTGINGLLGLMDIISLYISLSIILLLFICKTPPQPTGRVRDLLGNRYVIAAVTLYYIVPLIIVLIRFIPIIPESLGLVEVRRILSITLVSKIFYTFISLFVIALTYSLYRDIILSSRGVELRKKLLRELDELLENIIRGRDVYYMLIVEVMLLVAGILVYPIILFLLAQLHLTVGGFIYIIGIILTYISWIVLRTFIYKVFAASTIGIDEAKNILLYIWAIVATVIIVLAIYPPTTSIVTSMTRYTVEPSKLVSLFNKFYTGIVDLEFNAVKLLVELLWG